MELHEYLKSHEDQEAAMQDACYQVAVKNNHTQEEADLCDDLSVGCVDCPFIAVANTRNLTPRGADSGIQEAVDCDCICWDTDGDDSQYRVCPVHPLLS